MQYFAVISVLATAVFAGPLNPYFPVTFEKRQLEIPGHTFTLPTITLPTLAGPTVGFPGATIPTALTISIPPETLTMPSECPTAVTVSVPALTVTVPTFVTTVTATVSL